MANYNSIQGIYEIGIGCQDARSQVEYWEQFGYRIGQTGGLSAEAANKLYGVNSALQSVRLFHQEVDHGLIRLMVWENPTNNGLEMSSIKMKGTRWGTALTADILYILNHAEEAARMDYPIEYTPAYWEVIYNKERKVRPFVEQPIGVREMLMVQPLTRQVFFQRFGYSMPEYGQINKDSHFLTSQITHAGMIIQDDSKETLRFYEETLGLLRVRDDVETTYDSSEAGRAFFKLQPEENFIVTAFDDPRSSKENLQAARSGRLYIIRFPESIKLESCFDKSQPGCLGMSLYTYRVIDIEDYFRRIQGSAAKKVSELEVNEFGERSFSFIAPDGYFWTLLSRY